MRSPHSPEPSTARSENPAASATSGSSRSMTAVNAGSPSSRVRAMPAHCDPCPENTHTGMPGRRGAPSITRASSVPSRCGSASERRPSSSPS
ncbi:hypothetical protein BJF79_30400 [Actinomadura sp. CNU-125]|nr:hypothetical protein [Actinomadura sp. CNU-125]OLT36940.1 hypothetical protein BJF79_30400 [Actinomadura sp. CNU-125]